MKRQFGAWLMVFLCLSVLGGTITDFTLPRADGSLFRMRDHLGEKLFVIDFWASWCKPCKSLLKRLQEIKQEVPEVEVIAISIDDASARTAAESYIRGKGFDFITLFDAEGRVAKDLNPSMKIPFTLIIDRQGTIVYTHSGYIPGIESEIKNRLQEAQ